MTGGTLRPFSVRGISYDVGTDYAGSLTRTHWHAADVERDLAAIREQLHCNTVNIYGTDIDRLSEASRLAVDIGLAVWIQPRLIDRPIEEVLAHLTTAAANAERLHTTRSHGRGDEDAPVVFNLGCEWSVFTPSIIPGHDYNARAAQLAKPYWWPVLPWFNRRLNQRLRLAQDTARAAFSGPLTYSAGLWERVDWTRFDLVGLNYYRFKHNRLGFERRLRRQHRHRRPIVITEFGCGAFAGADALGPQTHAAVSYRNGEPTLRPGLVRDEHVQARYLTDLISIYERTGMYGAFAFEFIEPYKPHHRDPAQDLDMAGYSIVKVTAQRGPGTSWQPKAAYAALARLYRDLGGLNST